MLERDLCCAQQQRQRLYSLQSRDICKECIRQCVCAMHGRHLCNCDGGKRMRAMQPRLFCSLRQCHHVHRLWHRDICVFCVSKQLHRLCERELHGLGWGHCMQCVLERILCVQWRRFWLRSLCLCARSLLQHAMWSCECRRVHAVWQRILFDGSPSQRVHELSRWHVWTYEWGHCLFAVRKLPWQLIHIMQRCERQWDVPDLPHWIVCC